MDFDATKQVEYLATLPPEPPKPPERSAWGAPWRALKAGAQEGMASMLEALKPYAAGAAIAAEADPALHGVLGSKAVRAGAEEGRRQIRTGEATDFAPNELSKPFREAAHELRPDPLTAGTAEQLVFGVVRPVAKLVAGGVTMGPLGLGVASAEEGFTQSEDLRRQGVDLATRSKVGALTAAATGASAALPLAGSTLARTGALYLAGGPGAFMAQQAATSAILERANYGELSKQFDPFDPLGLAVSFAVPLPFAAAGAARNVKTSRAAKAKPAPERIEPTLDAPAEPVTPSVPPEAVDAAMVHNLTLRRDVHEAGMPTAQTANIPRAGSLPPIDRAIENRLAEKMSTDFEATAAEYAALKDSAGGKVLNTDIARELSPDYLADRTRSAAVHEPASWFIKELYALKLTDMPPGGKVMFSSGGTGAGKTTAIESVPVLKALADDAHVVYDTNMNSLASSVKKIEQALDAGANVSIVHVQRDPIEALVKGALPRAMRQAEQFGTGRTVPLVEHARTHRGAAEVVQQVAERYKNDPRVQIVVVDNTRGKGGAMLADLGFVRGFDYNGIEGKLYEALKQEHDGGRISGDVFRGTEGDAALGMVSADGRGHGRRTEPQRAGEGPGPSATGAIEGGLTQAPDLGALAKAFEQARAEFDAHTKAGGNLPSYLHGKGLPPEVNNLLIGMHDAAADPRRMRALLDQVAKQGAERGKTAADATADAVEGMRALTEDQLAGRSKTGKPSADPLLQSVQDRITEIETTQPGLVVRTAEDGRPITAAEELAEIRREAAEGTDVELGALDADLLKVAADCALSLG